MNALRGILVVVVALSLPLVSVAEMVTIPAGTSMYGELDQQVTSKKKDWSEGMIVRARAWRNVRVNGKVVIKAGAPIVARVSKVKKAKIAGVKGKLEIEAVSVRAIDSSDVMLDGGYDHSGKSRVGLSVALFAVVAWPLIFIKGKQAVLKRGTVFDCTVQEDTVVEIAGTAPVRIRLGGGSDLTAEVLYDEIDPEGKQKDLPIKLTLCEGELTKATVVTINGKEVKDLKLRLGDVSDTEEGCQTATASLNLKALGKHLEKGINRFEIGVGESRAEIILDVEL